MTGRQLAHYLVGEKIGEGGMGIVYKGTDTRLKRTIALKFLTKALPADAEERKRFLREARAASSVNHPNVCVIHAIEEVEGEEFIVMEFVEGQTLRKWANLKRRNNRATLVPVRETLELVLQIARGLEAAHKQGIVHRDVKPENVMVTPDGRAKIMDFGLAKLAGESKLTRSGATIGTVAYMSPEQVQGQEIDAQTDIYSYGVLLYELLAGTTPFQADHVMGMMYAIVSTEPRQIREARPGIEPELARIVMKCMAKEKRARYGTMRAVIQDFAAFEEHSKTALGPEMKQFERSPLTGGWMRPAALLKKNPLLAGMGAIVLVAVVIFFATRNGPPNGATLTVTSIPAGSHVWVNGTEVGLTPLHAYQVPVGRSIVHLVLDSYSPADTSIILADNQAADLRFPLRPVEVKMESSEPPPIARNEDSIRVVKPTTPASRPEEGPAKAISVDELATELVVTLQKGAGSLKGYVTVRPFTLMDTQIGSDFSRFFRTLLESRIGKLAHWELVSIDDLSGGSTQSKGPHAEYEVTGDYWEEGRQMHFFARLKDRQTGGYITQADAVVSSAEMKKKKIPWKPGNFERVVEDTKKMGKPEPERGDLKLELLTNKGTENLLFTEGDTLRTLVRVNKPCTVRVFYYATDGARYALTGSDDRKIDASQVNQLVQIDIASISAPFGADIVQAFATTGKFESIRTKQVDNGYYVVENNIESAMIATRGIKKLSSDDALIERKVVVTTIPK
jgi:tRNA A-37 threonylcarbamoyl transferase component Bud32